MQAKERCATLVSRKGCASSILSLPSTLVDEETYPEGVAEPQMEGAWVPKAQHGGKPPVAQEHSQRTGTKMRNKSLLLSLCVYGGLFVIATTTTLLLYFLLFF